MNIKNYEDSVNYRAIVVRISNLTPIEGLDKLVRTSIFGNDVLVSKDQKVGDIGLFFPSETQLSSEYLSNNNLYRHTNLNKNPEVKAGFFEDNGRCRNIKFKGVISTGLFMSLNSLDFIGSLSLKEGDEFNELEGVEICRKYVKKYNKSAGPKNQRKQFKLIDLVDTRCTPEHVDSEQLFRNLHVLDIQDIVSVSVKLHGSSLRVGYNIVYRKFNWFQKIVKKFIDLKEYDYRYIIASRRVIKSIDFTGLEGKKHYYEPESGTDIWTRAGLLFKGKLHKGEVVFAEIIGYDGNKAIQHGYTYGLNPGQFEVYIYRISQTNPDGISQDLSWPLLKQRCEELGIKYVPEIFYGNLGNFIVNNSVLNNEPNWRQNISKIRENWKEELERVIKTYFFDKPSIFTNSNWSNIEEGICLYKEKLGTFKYLKAKSPKFLLHETGLLDKGQENIEDTQ